MPKAGSFSQFFRRLCVLSVHGRHVGTGETIRQRIAAGGNAGCFRSRKMEEGERQRHSMLEKHGIVGANRRSYSPCRMRHWPECTCSQRQHQQRDTKNANSWFTSEIPQLILRSLVAPLGRCPKRCSQFHVEVEQDIALIRLIVQATDRRNDRRTFQYSGSTKHS